MLAIVLFFANEILYADEDEVENPERKQQIKIKNFAEQVVPAMHDRQFKMHFRLSRSTFDILLSRLYNLKTIDVKSGTPEIKLNKQLLITLWYIANLECFR
jgi:hypothetical protein